MAQGVGGAGGSTGGTWRRGAGNWRHEVESAVRPATAAQDGLRRRGRNGGTGGVGACGQQMAAQVGTGVWSARQRHR
jgi:hypothetical protein